MNKIKNKKKLIIFLTIGIISASGLTVGLVFLFRDKKHEEISAKPKINSTQEKHTNLNEDNLKKMLNEEQAWINKIKISEKINPLKSTHPNKSGEFNETIAQEYGIDFKTFDKDNFIFNYTTSDAGILIFAKLKDSNYQDLVPNQQAKLIKVHWMSDEDYKKQIDFLEQEQTRVNNLKSDESSFVLKPDQNLENIIFNEEVASAYKITFTDFNIKKFSYKYSTSQTGLSIFVRIQDSNLSSISPTTQPKEIKINWKTQEEINNITQNQNDLNEEQAWINKIKISEKINPLKSTHSNQSGEFNETIAQEYGIDFKTFDKDNFIFNYTTSDAGILIFAKLKDSNYQDLVPNQQAKLIKVHWMSDEDYKKQIDFLEQEQTRVNNLKSDESSFVLKPDQNLENIIFNEEVASAYKITFTDFNIKKFSYKYSTSQTGLSIFVRIQDNNLSSISPTTQPKEIKINWKTQEEINNITQNQNDLNEEQAWINKIKISEKINPLKSTHSNKSGEFNETIAQDYGIDFKIFSQNKFKYNYTTSDAGILIFAKLKDSNYQDLSPNQQASLIQVHWMSDEDYKKQIDFLEQEQTRVNNLKSDESSFVLKPDQNLENIIFNEEVASAYKITFTDFNIKKFSYKYSTSQTGLSIFVRIQDNNLSSISPTTQPKEIKINWKTQEEIKNITQNQKDLNEEQSRINGIAYSNITESELHKPLEKDFVNDEQLFDEIIAKKYGISFQNFNTSKFEYKYHSVGDHSISIKAKIKNLPSAIPQLVSMPIKIKWKEWKRGWYSKIQKSFPSNYTSQKNFNEIDNSLKKIIRGRSSSKNVLKLFQGDDSVVKIPNIHGVRYSIVMPHEAKTSEKKVKYIALIINSKNLRGVLEFWVQYQ